MSKERLKSGLRTNAGLTVIIAAAVLLQAISAVQYYYTRSLLADELEKRAESELTMKAIVIKSTLNMSENSLVGHIWDLKRNLAQPDSLYNVMEWVLRSHPNMVGCGVAFRPNHFPNKGRLFEPYAWWENGEIRTAQIASDRHDYTQMQFYRTAQEANSRVWSNAYHDSITSMDLVTYIVPIHDSQGDIVAVFGLDVSTSLLGDTLNYRHVYPSSYDILLTNNGELLAAPGPERVKRSNVENVVRIINDSTIAKTMSKNGRCKIVTFRNEDDHEKGYIYFASFKGSPDWQIAVVCYDKEVFGKLKEMRRFMGVLMLAALLVLSLIVLLFNRNNKRLNEAKLEKERIDSELRIARNIQMQMLPEKYPPYPERDDLDIYGSLVPAREVGGDLFDFFLRDEKLFFCIGDVSGKGTPSALLMASVHSMCRAFSAHENNPARIMQSINECACQGNDNNMFVTLFIGVLDLPTGRLRYCNAGHDVPITLRPKFSTLDCEANLPIGVFDDMKYEVQETQLSPGSTIFLYTDGVTEAMNAERQQFGLQRTENVLSLCAERKLNSEEIINAVSQEVHRFVRDAEQSDDLTMLAIKYTPTEKNYTLDETLTLKNDVKEVETLSTFVKQTMERMNIGKTAASQIRLALEEAVVNVIDYAYPIGTEGSIEVRMMSDGHRLKVMITDSGIPFDPTAKEKADTTLSAEERQIGGLGIHLVREIMDAINYERIDGKNVLTLIKKV